MSVYYKAVRPNGRDFHSGSVQWAPPEGHEGEWIVRHPTATTVGRGADGYLSVSTVPTDCAGSTWPARLLVVEPVDPPEPIPVSGDLPNKRAGVAFRVVGERPAHELFGPQGEQVVELIERARTLSGDEIDRLAAVWGAALTEAWGAAEEAAWHASWGAALTEAWGAAEEAAWHASWEAARAAARYAARDAAGYAARDAAGYAARDAAREVARDAALGLLSRDLIGEGEYTQEHYDALTWPWRAAVGRIHPNDPEVHS